MVVARVDGWMGGRGGQQTHQPHTTNNTKTHYLCRVLDFLLAEAARPRFCLWWAALLLGFTRCVVPVSRALKLRRILVRKLFHVLAVVMFVPATYAQVGGCRWVCVCMCVYSIV